MSNSIPMPKSMTAEQVDDAVLHYRTMLSEHCAEIGWSPTVQQVLCSPDYLKEQIDVLRKYVAAVDPLTFLGKGEVWVVENRSLSDFFKNHAGLRIDEKLRGFILPYLEIGDTRGVFEVSYYEITSANGALTEQIGGRLGSDGTFGETQGLVIIAELIFVQEGGVPGLLLINGNANLFCMNDWVISVTWCSGDHEWVVSAHDRDWGIWYYGRRVFSLCH